MITIKTVTITGFKTKCVFFLIMYEAHSTNWDLKEKALKSHRDLPWKQCGLNITVTPINFPEDSVELHVTMLYFMAKYK